MLNGLVVQCGSSVFDRWQRTESFLDAPEAASAENDCLHPFRRRSVYFDAKDVVQRLRSLCSCLIIDYATEAGVPRPWRRGLESTPSKLQHCIGIEPLCFTVSQKCVGDVHATK